MADPMVQCMRPAIVEYRTQNRHHHAQGDLVVRLCKRHDNAKAQAAATELHLLRVDL